MTAPVPLGIRHVAIRVRDLKKSEDFYVGLLGYRVEWRPDADNVYLTLGSDNLALHREEKVLRPGALDHFGLCLRKPEDVDAWAARLRAAGVTLAKEPKTHRDGSRSFYAEDPEGNLIQFIHHPPLAAAP